MKEPHVITDCLDRTNHCESQRKQAHDDASDRSLNKLYLRGTLKKDKLSLVVHNKYISFMFLLFQARIKNKLNHTFFTFTDNSEISRTVEQLATLCTQGNVFSLNPQRRGILI